MKFHYAFLCAFVLSGAYVRAVAVVKTKVDECEPHPEGLCLADDMCATIHGTGGCSRANCDSLHCSQIMSGGLCTRSVQSCSGGAINLGGVHLETLMCADHGIVEVRTCTFTGNGNNAPGSRRRKCCNFSGLILNSWAAPAMTGMMPGNETMMTSGMTLIPGNETMLGMSLIPDVGEVMGDYPSMVDIQYPSKSWPQVVGMTGEQAKAFINADTPGLKVVITPINVPHTADYQFNRVRVYVDDKNRVVSAPILEDGNPMMHAMPAII